MNGEPLFHFPDEKLGKGGNVTEVCADLYQSLEESFDKMMNLEPELFNTKGKYETDCKDRDKKEEEQSLCRKGVVDVSASKS